MKSVHSLVLAASLAAGVHALDDGSGPFYQASTGHANAGGNSTANLVLAYACGWARCSASDKGPSCRGLIKPAVEFSGREPIA